MQQALGIINDPANANQFSQELAKSTAKHPAPAWNEAQIKVCGQDEYDQMLATWNINVAKEAVSACINKAFGIVMGAGVTTNPHAPATIDAVDTTVIEQTLGKIRAVRKGSVQRAYSNRRK